VLIALARTQQSRNAADAASGSLMVHDLAGRINRLGTTLLPPISCAETIT